MNIAYRTPLTVPEYLAWADAQSERPRTELIDGQVNLMSPERIEHVELKLSVAIALTLAVEASGLDLHAITEGIAVVVDERTAFQPDALVYEGARLPRGALAVPAPVIVVEVLSPSTAHLDRGVKLTGYFSVPSVQHYLIIDPETMGLTHNARSADGTITATFHTGGTLDLEPPGLKLDLDRLFAN